MSKNDNKKMSENFRDSWDVDDPIDIDTPLDDSVYIDMDELDQKAKDESKLMFKDLERIYSNEQFMADHPEYKKRLDIELESLRILIKMRKSDEVTHDILVKQIGMTPNNASLYSALNRMQTSMINIQTKLDSTVKTINQLLKNYQMELPFEKDPEETTNSETSEVKTNAQTFRGTKAFMNHMLERNSQTFYPVKHFLEDDNLPYVMKDGNLSNQLDLFESEEAV